MLISRKTHCMFAKCKGELRRDPVHKDDFYFTDVCNKCGGKKLTVAHNGYFVYQTKGKQARD